MDQQVSSIHRVDTQGNPTGGTTTGRGILIEWQNGPLVMGGQRIDPNGAFVEGVINAVIDRLDFYQNSKFRCRENALAITELRKALHWLNARTASREKHGVEGTHDTRPEEG